MRFVSKCEPFGEVVGAWVWCVPVLREVKDGRGKGWSYQGTALAQFRYPESARAAIGYRESIPNHKYNTHRTFKLGISNKEFDIEPLNGRPPQHFTGPRVVVQGGMEGHSRLHSPDDDWHTIPENWGFRGMRSKVINV